MNPIQLAEIRRIAEWLAEACGDDERLFEGMTEGESPAGDVLETLYAQLAHNSEMASGLKARMDTMAERKARYDIRDKRIRDAIGMVLRAAGMTKWELPEATLSVRDGKPRLTVTDEAAVPTEYCKVKFQTDKTAINEVFADAAELPNWLTREPASDVVTVRSR